MRAAIDLLLCHLYHPRIPFSLLSEGLTMLKRAKYFVAIYVVAIAVAVLVVAPSLLQAQQTPINPDVYGQLKYRYIGPEGNRATSVAGVPGKPNIWYVGAASGGIFKSTDGGIHWNPIFDSEPVASIGSLAVADSDPNIVWAGTGESFVRSHISVGQGIYKSLDAGKTWSLMGLEKAGRIGRVEIDPRNPDIVLACALGHAYGPQPDRGVFRTTDGGKTWDKVLFVDENTGCSDLGMDPNNSRILFAGMWQIEIHTWGRTSGGPGSGLFKSTDGGVTWKRLEGHGKTPTACTRRLKRATACRRRTAPGSSGNCGVPTTAARIGRWSTPTGSCAGARITTRARRLPRTTRTKYFFSRRRFRGRSMAATRSASCLLIPAATITRCGSIPPTEIEWRWSTMAA
jgi:photosystem II stability/assembly factor-like uncharacterized protein